MNNKRRRRTWILYLAAVAVGGTLLTVGPMIINYMFATETSYWNIRFAFSAGEMLDYYGAVLGGLVTCFAIISAIHINNLNIREDRERDKFERAYEIYHKLPEILSKLELAAVHVQYSIHISENALIETLDSMKECDSALREQHFLSGNYLDKEIDALLTQIADASTECQECVEGFLKEMEVEEKEFEPPHDKLEAVFSKLRESIGNAKNRITTEINKFIFNKV